MSNLEMKVDALVRLVTAEDAESYGAAKANLQDLVRMPPQERMDPQKLITVIEDSLTNFGMPNNILGFDYTAEAIRLAVEDREILKEVTTRLYPSVARTHQTTPSRAERAIRHGIELCWNRCDLDLLNAYFGNSVDPEKGKPTNSQFIARVASVIRREMNGAA
ncbi:MAG: sporulation initiation factor Spo0A C-terminal domain-containing protein [Oscillospiraceae bacterium]|nr:sporulation initiation factor Spo0A C-terminal domain-containing protein [Oscillospiraceae bacterium]